MFNNYKYEKPAFIAKRSTDALTAAFAGGGWLHLNDPHRSDKASPKYDLTVKRYERRN
ncbi:MAG: hypothetical protein H8D67_17345 [Deltaproteobacteria bacterium]|nr:hypothetical protein [Deltaproteobacteria bacterium]